MKHGVKEKTSQLFHMLEFFENDVKVGEIYIEHTGKYDYHFHNISGKGHPQQVYPEPRTVAVEGYPEPREVDYAGRVWMHCEEGLSLSKASMSRFMMYCLTHNVEIGSVHPFNANYKNSLVIASVRLRPNQFQEFEKETGGKLRHPAKIHLN